jgi:hypothetical protein
MLKVRNHREGFEDSMKNDDIDALIFSGSSDRTKNTKTTYTIEAQTKDHTFAIGVNQHLILPLLSADGELLSSGKSSKNPTYSSGILQVRSLSLDGTNLSDITWSIVGMSGSENVSLSGTGGIV